jgi:hypothetical protein
VTFRAWRRDKAFVEKIKRAVALRLYKRLQKIESGADGWQGTGWVLERLYPTRFAKPEIQLSFNNNTLTQNYLSISITGEQARAIEAEARPSRERVAKMFEQYRPQDFGEHSRADSRPELEARDVEVLVSSEQPVLQAAEPAKITHRDGDEKRPGFWQVLVESDPQSPVAKQTAIFAIRSILLELQGLKAHRAEIEFGDDPVRLGDLFALLEKLSGPNGWQLMQRKAGF